jgi:hypothetical protein
MCVKLRKTGFSKRKGERITKKPRRKQLNKRIKIQNKVPMPIRKERKRKELYNAREKE